MKIVWYGHSCFGLYSREGSVIFDPYRDGSVPGLKLPELSADMVICSHAHDDHGAQELVALTGAAPDFGVEQLFSWHDDVGGAKRGSNTISVITAEGLRVAHLGDLGHELPPGQLKALGHIDVLLIPVGGCYTIDAATAKRVADAVGAAVTVPMHYRDEGWGYPETGPVADYAALCGSVVYAPGNSFEPRYGEETRTLILKMVN